MNSLWLSKPSGEDNEENQVKPSDAPVDTADVGPDQANPQSQTFPVPSQRPLLQRNQATPSLPPPPSAPVPPNSQSASQPPTDSLSLGQLRKFVAEINKPEPIAYDFDYQDLETFEEEVDEWFVYQFGQWVRLNAAQAAFESQWESHQGPGSAAWEQASHETRSGFVRECLENVPSQEPEERSNVIRILLYLILGRWADTASPPGVQEKNEQSAAGPAQLATIKSAVELITSLGGMNIVWRALQNRFQSFWSDDLQFLQSGRIQEAHDEILNLMTIMYISVQATLSDPEALEDTRSQLLGLNPSLVNFMSFATSKMRWDETNALPLAQILLLLWKSVLLVFGGTDALDEAKKAIRETDKDEKSDDTISASPLDYHVFRQELTSKYPAYVPPQPKIPLETDNSTLLPPPPNQPPKSASNGIVPTPPNAQSGGASILHQSVHIATPAPSPPPSPGVGKGGKKQNYQTNQNFPFMYPPLDATSNSAGGKGGAGMQETLVGRRWEGSDIPASILEAGQLFSQRVRMSRATRQLWDEREKFLKSERGWDGDGSDDDDVASDLDLDDELDLDLEELTTEERELIAEATGKGHKRKKGKGKQPQEEPEVDLGRHDTVDEQVRRRMLAVENFYRELLPYLQSLVIVLLGPIFMNVSALAQPQPGQQHPGMAGRGAGPGPNGGPGPTRQAQDPGIAGNGQDETPEMSPEDIDAARTREIMTKAATGTLLLLLKWLKLSHTLKFEYMTQLLLDHNYIPLVLKLFAHQDIQQVVDSKTDRIENSFFYFCSLRSHVATRKAPEAEAQEENQEEQADEAESEDDAAPPPIKMRREPPRPSSNEEAVEDPDTEDVGAAEEGQQPPQQLQPSSGSVSSRPEVDELGYPINPLPQEPITDFSRRNFFSLINYLRVMQKLCKRKAHRNLLLVQYKSSNILRKSLKVPQPLLRLYTLKLFKNQVPYCGRKWRQGNMRVITAVYLHVRPELRDEWLAGSDVDAEVDSALPLEQALRSLTHWFNIDRYPEKVAGGAVVGGFGGGDGSSGDEGNVGDELRNAYKEEQGFFARELEKMGMNWQDIAGDDSGSEWSYEEGGHGGGPVGPMGRGWAG